MHWETEILQFVNCNPPPLPPPHPPALPLHRRTQDMQTQKVQKGGREGWLEGVFNLLIFLFN